MTGFFCWLRKKPIAVMMVHSWALFLLPVGCALAVAAAHVWIVRERPEIPPFIAEMITNAFDATKSESYAIAEVCVTGLSFVLWYYAVWRAWRALRERRYGSHKS